MIAKSSKSNKGTGYLRARWIGVGVTGLLFLSSLQNIQAEDAASASAAASTSAGETTTSPGYRIVSASDDASSPIWEIYRGDRPIATYRADVNGTPGFYPLLSPSGFPLTRNYPMQAATNHNPNAEAAMRFEKQDHPHHRSMWFNHGDVNGLDFWVDKSAPKVGRIIQKSGDTRVQAAASVVNEVAVTKSSCTIQTRNQWNTPGGEALLHDERVFRFDEHLGDTIIDTTIRLIADEQPVTFGDTKEGTFGVRVAGSMKVDAKLGGQIHNAEGFKDDEAWSKASAWVDYSGPIVPADLPSSEDAPKVNADDAAAWSRAGITMMYHPDNELDQCRWHVRSYGLFAANPFGRHHFGLPAYDGVRIEPGQTLTLHFRVVLHDGGFDAEKATTHFRDYAATPIQ